MAKTATREHHIDDSPLFTGTHKGTAGYLMGDDDHFLTDDDGDYLYSDGDDMVQLTDKGMNFRALGVTPDLGLSCVNETEGTAGAITAATENTVTATGVTWSYGDTYSIYKTATKDTHISSIWCDVSRGQKIEHPDDINSQGWRWDDVDWDDRGRANVFGPLQPEV